MKRCSSLTIITIVAVGCLLVGAIPSSAQGPGPYYPLPAWDQRLPASARFVRVLFEEVCTNNFCIQIAHGILDRETGLVWERSPSSELSNWSDALRLCATREHGNRMGWRLPTVDELTSLRDASVDSEVMLPLGHPFAGVSAETFYWTSTQSGITISGLIEGSFHYTVDLQSQATAVVGSVADNHAHHAWCVRGGAK